MNWLEKQIAKLSPDWALNRLKSRSLLSAYEAAKPSRKRKMVGESRGPDLVANESLVSLRSQARHYDENYDLVTGALDTLVMRICGPKGIMVEPMVKNKNGDLHDEFNRQINELYHDWYSSPEVTGDCSGAMCEQLAARTWIRDGEMFAQLIEGERAGLRTNAGVPFFIELLEPDLVPLDYEDRGNSIIQGIKKNNWGRATNYMVYKSHPNDYSWRLPTVEDLKSVPADRILHLKMIKRIRQTRGISLLHSVITRIEDLKDYEESERVAARIAAAAAFYIKKGSPDTFIPEDEDDEDRSFKIAPGMIFDRLEPGEEVGSIQSNRPSALLEPFRNSMVKMFAAGMRMSYSSAAKSYDGNYSSQRQELIENWDHYTTLQQTFASRFKKPVYNGFLRMAIASGKLKIPRDVDRDTLFRAHYQGPSMPWIDPQKESAANQSDNMAGYKSRSTIIRSRNENPIEVEEQLARERKREESLGLILTSNPKHEYSKEKENAEVLSNESAVGDES